MHNGRACVHKRINQSKRTSCNKQKTNASNHTKKTIRVHVAAATATATSTVKATATAAATARAIEQRKKKWVNRYKAISSSVVFLLWSRASYATDVRYFCVNIHRGNYHYYFFECNLIESVIHVNFAEKKYLKITTTNKTTEARVTIGFSENIILLSLIIFVDKKKFTK